MKKRVRGQKLSRSTTTRRALSRSLLVALVEKGKIKTTAAKAKFVLPFAEKLLTKAKKGDLSARRQVMAELANNRQITGRIFELAAVSQKQSGFLKLTKLHSRRGDKAPMVEMSIIGWVPDNSKKKETKSKVEKTAREKVEKGRNKSTH